MYRLARRADSSRAAQLRKSGQVMIDALKTVGKRMRFSAVQAQIVESVLPVVRDEVS